MVIKILNNYRHRLCAAPVYYDATLDQCYEFVNFNLVFIVS